MLRRGFVDEVRGLRARGDLHAGLPSVRLIGYRQLWQHLEGALTLAEARKRPSRQPDSSLAASSPGCVPSLMPSGLTPGTRKRPNGSPPALPNGFGTEDSKDGGARLAAYGRRPLRLEKARNGPN